MSEIYLTQQRTSLTVKSLAVKSDENMTNLLKYLIRSGLAFKHYSSSLKSFISAPVRLIGKRGLICDHRKYLSTLDECLFTLKNICLLISDFDRGPFQDFSLTFKKACKLKSQFAGFL